MIRRLRKNIILVNMLFVGTVILFIFAAVCINSYVTSRNELERSLGQAVERSFDEFDHPPEKFGEKKHDDFQPMLSSFIVVSADSYGNILSKNEINATIDDDILEHCVSEAINENRQFGEISQYGLSYFKKEQSGQITIAFADNSSIYSSLKNTVLICVVLFIASIAVIFLISLALSGIAVNPVKEAWNKQKQFIADASHELKTPLTVILANNNIIAGHGDSTISQEMKWLQSTQEEALHMKKLIEQMLFLAKSDSGSIKSEFTDVNISEIAQAASLNFEPVAFESGVIIDSRIEPNIIMKSDPTLLTQLFGILIENAVKYSEQGNTVTITLYKREKVTLSVNNKGDVLTSEEKAHIFDRFYRGDKSRSTNGYGLGLSIAKNITSVTGGKISVESNEKHGTTFKVEWNIQTV